jgi:D-sedoheptulose 7-phosphate isomerase
MDPLKQLVERYPDLEACLSDIEQARQMLSACYRAGGKLLVCGNGGSAADSEHIVGELMKGYMLKRPIPAEARQRLQASDPERAAYLAEHLQGALPAISLVSQSALMTAYANDIAADMVFAQQVYGYGRPGDVLWAISTSGNAANVVNAVQIARGMGLKTLGLTGAGGGKLKALCDVTIRAPGSSTPEYQERHLPIYHTLCVLLEMEFFTD